MALLAILSITGIRVLTVSLGELTALQLTDPQLTAEKYPQLLFFFGVATVFISSGAGGALGFVFYEALITKQFPPPEIRLLWDTKLLTGNEARRLAIAGMTLAIILTLCGIGLGVVMISIARTAFSGPFLKPSLLSGGHFFS